MCIEGQVQGEGAVQGGHAAKVIIKSKGDRSCVTGSEIPAHASVKEAT